MELLVTKLKQAKVLFASGFMSSTLSLCMWLNIQKYLQKGAGRDRGEKGRSGEAKGLMLLFTSGNFPAVPRVMAFTARERGRVGGKEEGPQAAVGEENKGQGADKETKSRMWNTAKAKRTFFRQEKEKEEMPKCLSGFFIVSPRNTASSTGSGVQRFLQGKNKPVSRSLTNCSLKNNIQENSYLKFSRLLAQKYLLIKSRQFSLPFST